MLLDVERLPLEGELPHAAITLARAGARVVPLYGLNDDGSCQCKKGAKCATPAKHPRLKEWEKRTTNDPDTVAGWWRHKGWQTSNIGWAMGGEDRLVALDVDGAEGRASLAALEAKHGPLPATLTSRSGREDGGEHRIFRASENVDLDAIPNRASHMAEGLDVRAEGGQIVVAPSRHASGRRYSWATVAPIAELPRWLYDLMVRPRPKDDFDAIDAALGAHAAERAREREPATSDDESFRRRQRNYCVKWLDSWGKKLAQAGDGQRNDALNKLVHTAAGFAAAGHLEADEVWAAATAAMKANGYVQTDGTSSVSKTFNSAWRAGSSKPIDPRNVRPNDPRSVGKPARAKPPIVAPPDPDDPDGEVEIEGGDWRNLLHFTKRDHEISSNASNVATILRHDPAWRGVVELDERRNVARFVKPPPFPADLTSPRDTYPREIIDPDLGRIQAYLARAYGFVPGLDAVSKGLDVVAAQRPRDPVREYLDALEWDGVERIATWTRDYLTVPDDAYSRGVGERWLISAVARTYQPGCQADYMLILEGKQGTGKSTALRTLAGPDEFFSDELQAIGSKDAADGLRGPWVIEMSELDGAARAEVTALKAFVSRRADRYRPAYGYRTMDFPRRCVFAASTNENAYNRDATGARRFWPLRTTGKINTDAIARDRDQLWAEAVVRYREGKPWWPDSALDQLAGVEQEARYQEDAWVGPIGEYIEGQSEIAILEIAVTGLGIELQKVDMAAQNRIARCLQQLKWTRSKNPLHRHVLGKKIKTRMYCPPGADEPEDEDPRPPPPREPPKGQLELPPEPRRSRDDFDDTDPPMDPVDEAIAGLSNLHREDVSPRPAWPREVKARWRQLTRERLEAGDDEEAAGRHAVRVIDQELRERSRKEKPP